MRRPGFTLIEIMVALMVLSGLLAVMLPVVMDQATRGEPTRTGADLTAVASALSMFRVHALTLPDDLEDLVNPVGGLDRQVDGTPYSASMLQRWNGPYLDLAMAESGGADPFSPDSVATGFRAYISPALALYDGLANDSVPAFAAGSANFVALMIRGLDAREFETLNDVLDGQAEPDGTPGCAGCSYDRGNLRWDPATGIAYYLAVPYRRGS